MKFAAKEIGVRYLAIVIFIIMFGIAGRWDYQEEMISNCSTDTECMEMYRGDGGPGI